MPSFGHILPNCLKVPKVDPGFSGHFHGAREALDVRILHSIPTPVADALISRGCRQAPDVTPEALKEAPVPGMNSVSTGNTLKLEE